MAVTGLLARGLGLRAIRLTWTPEPYALGYIIYRGLSAVFSASAMVANVGPDAGTYTDYPGSTGVRFFYWVLTSTPALTSAGPVDAWTSSPPNDSPVYSGLMKPLADWSAMASIGIPVVWANQPGIVPTKPFIRLSLTGPFKVPSTDFFDEALENVSGMRRWLVSVNVFTDPVSRDEAGIPVGLDAMDIADRMVGSFETPNVEDLFTAAGIAEAGIDGQVTDVSSLLETKWERQAHFDFSLNVAFNREVSDPGTIDQVDLASIQAAFKQS